MGETTETVEHAETIDREDGCRLSKICFIHGKFGIAPILLIVEKRDFGKPVKKLQTYCFRLCVAVCNMIITSTHPGM
jgi:hypothetical protein